MAKKNDVTTPVTTATTTTLTLNTDERKNKDYVVYDVPGGGLVWIPSRRIAGEAPSELTLPMVFAPATSRAKMTEEQRKAAAEARKNRTPEQIAADAKVAADKAQERYLKAKQEAESAAINNTDVPHKDLAGK